MAKLIPLFLLFLFVQTLAINPKDYPYCGAALDAPKSPVPPSPSHSLAMLQLIIRHGDRTPENGLTDPFISPRPTWHCDLNTLNTPGHSLDNQEKVNRLYRVVFEEDKEVLRGNCNFGQLTDKGYDMHIALGQNLRKVYGNTTVLNLSTTKVRSTNVYRTLQSGMALLTGLFPPKDFGNVAEVIKISTRDREREDMTPEHGCPAYLTAVQQLYKEKAWLDYHNTPSYLNFTQYLMNKFRVEKLPDMYGFFDEYSARVCHKFPIPVTDDDFRKIEEIETYEWNYTLFPKAVGRLASGKFVSTLLRNLIKFERGDPTTFYLFSGHDSTIAPLLGALGIYDGTWPAYASHLQIELWSESSGKNSLVSLRYNGSLMKLPCQNANFCKMSEIKNWWRPVVPSESECLGL